MFHPASGRLRGHAGGRHNAPAGSLRFTAAAAMRCVDIVEGSTPAGRSPRHGAPRMPPAGGGFGPCAPVSSQRSAGGGRGRSRRDSRQAPEARRAMRSRLLSYSVTVLQGSMRCLHNSSVMIEMSCSLVGPQVRQGTRCQHETGPHRDGVLMIRRSVTWSTRCAVQVGDMKERKKTSGGSRPGADQAHQGGQSAQVRLCPQRGGGGASVLEGRGGK